MTTLEPIDRITIDDIVFESKYDNHSRFKADRPTFDDSVPLHLQYAWLIQRLVNNDDNLPLRATLQTCPKSKNKLLVLKDVSIFGTRKAIDLMTNDNLSLVKSIFDMLSGNQYSVLVEIATIGASLVKALLRKDEYICKYHDPATGKLRKSKVWKKKMSRLAKAVGGIISICALAVAVL